MRNSFDRLGGIGCWVLDYEDIGAITWVPGVPLKWCWALSDMLWVLAISL